MQKSKGIADFFNSPAVRTYRELQETKALIQHGRGRLFTTPGLSLLKNPHMKKDGSDFASTYRKKTAQIKGCEKCGLVLKD